MIQPQIGQPLLGTPTKQALDAANIKLAVQPALPELHVPVLEPLEASSAEPLVLVEHPRIEWLSNYERGGWPNSISKCWLRAEVATRLYQAVEYLPEEYGFAIFDAWRPRELQADLYYQAYSDPELPLGFLAAPTKDERFPAPHETGGAVDLSLSIEGRVVAAGTDFDDFSALAATAAFEGRAGADREARRLLYRVMNQAGFVILNEEWWHFEYGTPRWAAITKQDACYGATAPNE